MPTLDPKAKMWMNMLGPLQVMAQSKNNGEGIPALDTLSKLTKQLAIIYSLFWTEYDGGDFCQGLIFSKELATVFWSFGKTLFSNMFDKPETADSVQEYLMQKP